MPSKRLPKHRAKQPAARQASGQGNAAAQLKKLYGFFNRLADGVLETHHAEKQSVPSFLLHVLKFTGGVAAAMYRVEDKTVRLAGSYSVPCAIASFSGGAKPL